MKTRVLGMTVALLACFLFLARGGCFALDVGLTETSIKIGCIQDTTGPIAGIGIPRVEAARALINHINDQGGINGRKVVWTVESDNYKPTETVLAFKKLVEVDQVFCFVGSLGLAGTLAILQEIQNRKVPYLFVAGNDVKLFSPPHRYIFVIGSTYEELTMRCVDYIAEEMKLPKAKIAHAFMDLASGRGNQKGAQVQVQKYSGMQIVAEEAIKYGSVDVTATVFNLKKANPDVLLLGTPFEFTAMITKEMAKLGWSVPMVMNAANGSTHLIALGGSSVEGAIVQFITPLLDEDLPGMRLYKDLIKKYFPDSKANPSEYGLTGFIEMQLGLEALKRAGRNLTREGLIDTLETSFKNVETGLIPPVSCGPDNHRVNNQTILARVRDGKFVKVADWRAPK
jgi:branched-chain amino acid transport system substrate-binding protein